MARQLNRRDFIRSTAAGGAGLVVMAKSGWAARSPNATIAFGCIGVKGKGDSDSSDCAKHGDIVAICDVDAKRLGEKAKQGGFEKAKGYSDYRKMLEEMGKSIDAVTVSTADHMHAPIAAAFMREGKHAHVQKPLTHTLHEARILGQLAREKKLATQMGNQGTANEGLRRGAELVQAGAIGTPKECHVWTNRPVWPQGIPRPQGEDPVPAHLNWDVWQGAAPVRPYKEGVYHDFKWRGWWDYGTGALGDMACHTLNMPFLALDLRNPTSVEAKSSPNNKDSYPTWSTITFEFAATDKRPAVKLFWYDGGDKLPEDRRVNNDLLMGMKRSGSGSLMIGDKGSIYSPDDYGSTIHLLPEANFKDYKDPAKTLPRSPGHFQEWVRAIKGEGPSFSNFPDYAGPLTETILLGNLAVWAGKKVEWDAKNQKATNAPEVESLIRKTYRKGFEL